jgi:hypothetical protein
MVKQKAFKPGQAVTQDYVPSAYASAWAGVRHRLPRFSLMQVQDMLTDPRVEFGLRLIKGPVLSKSRFFVDCDNPEAKEFLKNTVIRFWRTSAARALKALEWGYSCAEAMYELRKGRIEFDVLKDLHSLDCRALTRGGKLVAAAVQKVPGQRKKKVPLPIPKLLWHIHARELHPWYGCSRLRAAYLPWAEMWADGGYRDARTLYYHKYAFEGGIMRHPPGTVKLDDGTTVVNKDLAREILEKKKTGGVMTLTNVPNSGFDGQYAWDYQPPHVMPPPENLLEYGKDLRDEMWEGMGIPPEIARAEGTGAYAGRKVPEDAFYSVLQEIVYWLMFDFDQQIGRPLVEVNFGSGIEYEIVPFGLIRPSMEEAAVEREAKLPRALEMSTAEWLLEPRYGIEIVSEVPPVGYTPKYGRAA